SRSYAISPPTLRPSAPRATTTRDAGAGPDIGHRNRRKLPELLLMGTGFGPTGRHQTRGRQVASMLCAWFSDNTKTARGLQWRLSIALAAAPWASARNG